MIVYLCTDPSWSTKVRAAAIGRHLDNFRVVALNDNCAPLDRFGIDWELTKRPHLPRVLRDADVLITDRLLVGGLNRLDMPKVGIHHAGGPWPNDVDLTFDLTETPIYSHDPDELPTRGEARDYRKDPVVVDLIDGPRLYPALPRMVGADLVRSYAGSMLCAEVQALGVPHLAIAKPGIPDQQDRANDPGPVSVLDRPDDWRPYYRNHARDIAAKIKEFAGGN